MEVGGGATQVNINTYGKKGYQEDSAQFGAAGGGVALGGLNTSTLTTENMHMYNQYRHFGRQDEMDFTGTGMITGQQQHLFYDGMALSDQFLGEYYMTVSMTKFN